MSETKVTAEELIELHNPIDRYDRDEARWGYREVQVFAHEGKHYAVPVYVTTGDEGGVEAEGEPAEVRKVKVTSYAWKAVE